MKPLFTVHAGEYLVAEKIERDFPELDVWLPTRDTGVDLLVTHPETHGQVSLQVKYSKDFRVTHIAPALQPHLRACGWWSFAKNKLEGSPADYWVLVLYGLARGTVDYLVVRPDVLLKRLVALHGEPKRFQTYVWTTESNRCWETCGLKKAEHRAIAAGNFEQKDRDLGMFLEEWSCLQKLNAT